MTMRLSDAEQAILAGSRGDVLQQVMATVVAYGEALGAEKLVEITGMGHFVITHAIPGISPSIEMLDTLIGAGLKTRFPFSLDPVAPLDYDNWWLTPEQVDSLQRMYGQQNEYDERMRLLGLWHPAACTCTPYLPEVGNLPKKGDILAWSESACVVFANSVLGARSNRNGAIIDLLCNIAGRVPLTGLLTDRGRKATWRVEVKTDQLPAPQILGAAIGKIVLAEVPFIAGLQGFLGTGINPRTRDYLHEMGAAAAAAGAVGLFHVENITPEAVDHERNLLVREPRDVIIDEEALQELTGSYPVMWKNKGADPIKCFLGCPHLSLDQLQWWADAIHGRLLRNGGSRLKVNTTICSAPQVLEEFRKHNKGWARLSAARVRFSTACPMQLFDNDLSRDDAIITNSNKLRTYTHARFFLDEEIVDIVVTGNINAMAAAKG